MKTLTFTILIALLTASAAMAFDRGEKNGGPRGLRPEVRIKIAR